MILETLVLAFNRPQHLEKCLQSMLEAGVRSFIINIDGPRVNNVNDVLAQYEILEIVNAFKSKFEKITIWQNNQNLGCKLAVSNAISQCFRQADFVTIIEDDICISKGFLEFLEYGAVAFENDERIGSISGWTPLEPSESNLEPWLYETPMIWGWGTWKNRWNNYDLQMSGFNKNDLPSIMKINSHRRLSTEFDVYWSRNFEICAFENWNTWDYQLVYSFWKKGFFVVMPPVRLCENIGFDDMATHTFKSFGRSDSRIEYMENIPLSDPKISTYKSYLADFLIFNLLPHKSIAKSRTKFWIITHRKVSLENLLSLCKYFVLDLVIKYRISNNKINRRSLNRILWKLISLVWSKLPMNFRIFVKKFKSKSENQKINRRSLNRILWKLISLVWSKLPMNFRILVKKFKSKKPNN